MLTDRENNSGARGDIYNFSSNERRNSISSSNHVIFCLLYKHPTNKKKSTLFAHQKENALNLINRASDMSVADW